MIQVWPDSRCGQFLGCVGIDRFPPEFGRFPTPSQAISISSAIQPPGSRSLSPALRRRFAFQVGPGTVLGPSVAPPRCAVRCAPSAHARWEKQTRPSLFLALAAGADESGADESTSVYLRAPTNPSLLMSATRPVSQLNPASPHVGCQLMRVGCYISFLFTPLLRAMLRVFLQLIPATIYRFHHQASHTPLF